MKQSSDITIGEMSEIVTNFRMRQKAHELIHGPIPSTIIMRTSVFNELKSQVPTAKEPEIFSFYGIPVEHYSTAEECRLRAGELAKMKVPVMLCEE